MIKPIEYSFRIWNILILPVIVGGLSSLSGTIVCLCNTQCRSQLPTLKNLLNSHFVVPFLYLLFYSLVALHFLIAFLLYYRTLEKVPRWSAIMRLTATLAYLAMFVTLWVFPATDWDGNWANLTILIALSIWMLIVCLALQRFYEYRIERPRRKMLVSSVFSTLLYIGASVAYVVTRALNVEPGVLLSEILCAIGGACFLLLSLGHVWDAEFTLKFKGG